MASDAITTVPRAGGENAFGHDPICPGNPRSQGAAAVVVRPTHLQLAHSITTVLLAGSIETGPGCEPAQAVMTAIAEGKIHRPATAWHCCLEFYSVSTRLPPELRLTPRDASELLREEILGRFEALDLPAEARWPIVQEAMVDQISGGRVHDLHVAHVAQAHGMKLIVADNRPHFGSLLRYGVRVLATQEFAREAHLMRWRAATGDARSFASRVRGSG